MNIDRSQFVEEFSELLTEPAGVISLETQLAELENWDSISVLSFILHVDKKFGRVLSPDEIARCEVVGDLAGLLERAA